MGDQGGARVGSLDGLRGVAALGVVVDHTVMASRSWEVGIGSGPWFLSKTPLNILWSGQEMVVIFFVLSGYVLALPAVKRSWRWLDASYYPRRIVRLYLPAIGALVFAGVMHAVFVRHFASAASPWLNKQVPLSITDGLQDASLLHQPGAAQYLGIIWSMKYEVAFSLLLPAMLVVPLATRNSLWAAALAAVGCLCLIHHATVQGAQTLGYLPMFALGSLLAFQAPRLPVRWTASAALLALGLLTVANGSQRSPGTQAEMAAAAVLVVWLALASPGFSRLLGARPAAWLGARSYSLYLVHLPVVLTLGFAFGGRARLVPLLALTVPLSLLAADVFWRFVERRAVSLARAAGAAFSSRRGHGLRAPALGTEG